MTSGSRWRPASQLSHTRSSQVIGRSHQPQPVGLGAADHGAAGQAGHGRSRRRRDSRCPRPRRPCSWRSRVGGRLLRERELLRPDRHPDRLAGDRAPRRGRRRCRSRPAPSATRTRSRPASTTRASSTFTSPRKSATNRLVGYSYISPGVPSCADPPLVHDRHPGRDGHRLLLVVGDDDEGQAQALLDVDQLELRAPRAASCPGHPGARRAAAPWAA